MKSQVSVVLKPCENSTKVLGRKSKYLLGTVGSTVL